jgi:flagellar basal body rod protein FlgC
MNKEQLETKKKEAWDRYASIFHTQEDHREFSNGFDVGVKVMQVEVEELKETLSSYIKIDDKIIDDLENKVKKMRNLILELYGTIEGVRYYEPVIVLLNELDNE